jgi:hypothetical protein
MSLRHTTLGGLVCTAFLIASTLFAQGAARESFTATASVKGAGGAAATAPVTVTVDRKMSQAEADKLLAAFKSGGAEGLRKALNGVAPTGSVKIGGGKATPTRVTVERATDKGRLLTIVADQPILFLGAGVPEAKPKTGYDFAVIDLEVDAKGGGSGTMAPAAKVTVKNGAFVVEDYGGEVVRLTKVAPGK